MAPVAAVSGLPAPVLLVVLPGKSADMGLWLDTTLLVVAAPILAMAVGSGVNRWVGQF